VTHGPEVRLQGQKVVNDQLTEMAELLLAIYVHHRTVTPKSAYLKPVPFFDLLDPGGL